jgi:hypothetical protein
MAVIDPFVLDGLPAEVTAFLVRVSKLIPCTPQHAAMALFMTFQAAENPGNPEILAAINDPELGFYDLTPEEKQRLFAILFTSDPPPRMDSLHG